jgi:hypothetical protein
MVILTLSKYFNRLAGPFLLRSCIWLRDSNKVGYQTKLSRFMVPAATWSITLEIHYENTSLINKELQKSDSEDHVDRTAIQLSTLSKYVRKPLLPSETWSDVKKWQFYPEVSQWARLEYLKAKYGYDVYLALIVYPSLTKSPQIANTVLGTPDHGALINFLVYDSISAPVDNTKSKAARSSLEKLPSTQQLLKAFQIEDWSISKNRRGSYGDMIRTVRTKLGGDVLISQGGASCLTQVENENTSTSNLLFEEVLEVGGIPVLQTNAFHLVCEHANIYQMWTREYIEHLGQYLQNQSDSFDGETLILDVGAGDGILSQCLREFFHVKYKTKKANLYPKQTNGGKQNRSILNRYPPLVIATDNYSARIETKAKVLHYDAVETVDFFTGKGDSDEVRQVIVICSWMPKNEDWTKHFRESNVDEYILIGEADDGHCGDNWATWGNPYFHEAYGVDNSFTTAVDEYCKSNTDDAQKKRDHVIPVPLYETDGYVRRNLDFLSRYQFSRFDSRVSKNGQTVSFRRSSTEKT